MDKICFVVMGFGKKMDYRNSKIVDLDIVYSKVIKRELELNHREYKVIRADEISGSDIIDVAMYSLLIRADLVIADISTMNENAIYELGVRHALKPFSTIIMLQNGEKTNIPFDLNHSRILTYNDYGDKLDDEEAKAIRIKLGEFIKSAEKNKTDSPFYTYMPNTTPPKIENEEYKKIIEEVNEKEGTVYKSVDAAKTFMKESNFVCAIEEWKKVKELLPHNLYGRMDKIEIYYTYYDEELPFN